MDNIYKRNIPDRMLKPLFDFRSKQTRYEFSDEYKEPIKTEQLEYKKEPTFNPGDKGEVDIYIKNIDTESSLRNQFMVLQRDTQSYFILDADSKLFTDKMNYDKNNMTPFEGNKNSHMYDRVNKNKLLFNNSTRNDVKNYIKKKELNMAV